MTLDELIVALQTLRERHPTSGGLTVVTRIERPLPGEADHRSVRFLYEFPRLTARDVHEVTYYYRQPGSKVAYLSLDL